MYCMTLLECSIHFLKFIHEKNKKKKALSSNEIKKKKSKMGETRANDDIK